MAEPGLSVSLRQSAPIPLEVEFTCNAGDVLAIFGPSGSGKTTILRSIAGLYRPAHAAISSQREVWNHTASETFLAPHRRAVGFVFQEHALFPHLTALDNVMTALGHLPRPRRRSRAEELIVLMHLSDQKNRRPAQLSGGERQRVALARALARDPSVLLLDEPFAAVDRMFRRRLQDEIDELRATVDIPIVLVTHDFDDVVRLATHLLILDRGRAIASGLLSELTSRAECPWLRDAVGLGSVFDARVAQCYAGRGLVELRFEGGALLAADAGLVTGSTVRVRIPAREVILAVRKPEGLSLHNLLEGTVAAVANEPAFENAIVQIAVGSVLLLAEVTRDAIQQLGIAVGRPVYALIKSVSVDARGGRRQGRK